MKPIIAISAVSLILLTGLSFTLHTSDNACHKVKGNSGFAVVELFTSEGCSSCPPADEAVAALAKDYPGKVYILGFHVDYWNNLGWTDKFSAPEYTNRQRNYAAAFGLSSIYTAGCNQW